MKHNEAMQMAVNIAELIFCEAKKLGRGAVSDLSLFGRASLCVAARKGDFTAFDPRVCEILLFGSVARGGNDDIDLMMFDRGFYSNILSIEPVESSNDVVRDCLKDNLSNLLEEWFELSRKNKYVSEILDAFADIHVLPLNFFTDPACRADIAKRHRDPMFFQNAFSLFQRFDVAQGTFVPCDVSYLEMKYGADLHALRK